MVLFLLFTPKFLIKGAQQSFVDTRFVRDTNVYRGTITIYHIVRHRPYLGSLSNWLQKRADEYEKKHRGSFINIEGMDEASFYERLEYGRKPDAYSFFSGSLYRDLLAPLSCNPVSYKEGLFQTDQCVPYCYSGYVRLIKNPGNGSEKTNYANDILAAHLHAGQDDADEEQADILYTDLRRAGDLIRYKQGFAGAALQPIDPFTDAVCWLGVDRDTDAEKAAVIRSFIEWLLSYEQQQKLNTIGVLSVRDDLRDIAPESILKPIFAEYQKPRTVDPFLWYAETDTLREDAAAARNGDIDAADRFQKRFDDLLR